MKNVADIYGLTPMQELMLLHSKTADAAEDILLSQIVYQINGEIDSDALQKSWQFMIDRHPILRTLFVWQEGQDPVQIVREKVGLPWKTSDWRGFSRQEQKEQLADLLKQDRLHGFDLLRPPLMRLHLIQLSERSYWMVWSSHHLILDRWCIGIVLDELSKGYLAFSRKQQPNLGVAPRFRDYIAWLDRQDEANARSFWQDALRGVTAGRLPLISQGQQGQRMVDHSIRFSSGETADLRQFALDNNVTMSTLVSAAWSIVLGAATNSDDTMMGLTVSGRPADLPNISKMLGSFINNVPLRIQLEGSQSLKDWLAQIQDRQLGLGPYEYASPGQIWNWAELSAGGQMFDSLLVMQPTVRYEQADGLDIRFYQGGMQTGYAISVAAAVDEDGLDLNISRDPGQVTMDLGQGLADALQKVLKIMPNFSNRSLSVLREAADLASLFAVGSRVADEGFEPQSRVIDPPQNAEEAALAAIWSDVLNLVEIGRDEGFFDIGGNSLSAMQAAARIQQQFGVDFPLRSFFEEPTLAGMARRLPRLSQGLQLGENEEREEFFL